ncbi:site-specific integrase [Clostridium sp. C2-6-12]|uniref:tyrosine-type recombinase/integrase n=1 Tax=Clostridium sp. C2-6-12 TaxID=2698832 RepID=UPI00136FDC25|nr:site-specific integrase [Clostridium sp. C2-6-12]
MKISDMDEREFNRFQNLSRQAESAYKERIHSFRTEDNYRQGMGEFIKYLASETKLHKLENIKAKHLIGFADQLKENGISASTQKTYLCGIRDFADRFGIDQRNIPSNERLGLDKRIFGNVDRSWTNKEFQDFKEVAEKYDKDKGQGQRMELILETCRNFGCRLEGVLNLDLNAINKALDNGELMTKEKNGKINIKPVERLDQREVLEKIKALGEENGQRKIFIGDNFKTTFKEVENFIYNNRSRIQLEERMITVEARKSFQENGIVVRSTLSIHGLRYNYAKEKMKDYISNGMSLHDASLKVSQLMGHNREEITKIYLASAE